MSKNPIYMAFLVEFSILANKAEALLRSSLINDQWTEDEEKIHDLRILIRMMISLHEFYEPLLKKRIYEEQILIFKRLLKALGQRRREDVYIKLFRTYEECAASNINSSEDHEKSMELLHSIMNHTKKKNELFENPFYFRIWFYKGISIYYLDQKVLFDKKWNQKGMLIEEFINLRIKHLLKENKRLEKKAQSGEDEKIHQFRVQGKTLYYNLKIHKKYLKTEKNALLDKLKKTHDITGKLHDLHEILNLIEKSKKDIIDRSDLERLAAYFNTLWKKKYEEFLVITNK